MLDNLSDKEFENLFRKVSDSQEIEYNPEGWDAMRTVLLKEKRRRRLLWSFLGLATLLLMATTTFLLGPKLRSIPTEGNTAPSEQVHNDQSIKVDRKDPISITEISASVEDKTELPSDLKKNEPFDELQPEKPKDAKAKTSEPRIEDLNRKIASNQSNAAKPKPGEKLLDSDPLPSSSSMSDPQMNSSRVKVQSNIDEIPKSNSRAISTLERLPSLSLHLIVNPPTREKPSVTQSSSTPIEVQGKKSPIAVELGLSREWTSTSLSYLNKGDIRIGIKVDFPISKKLAMGLGLEYYVDRYQISAGEYSPPKGFWTYDVAPLSTYARCAMLDIPIHLTFHFSGIDKPGVFASIGATSINILEETYQYTYEKPNSHLIQEWSGSNTGRQIFNSIRLASGYKFRLKKQWFVTVSPYVQIPISGIGFGDVKLYTVGTTLSVRLQKNR